MTRTLALGTLALALTGCGTVMNLYLPPEQGGSQLFRVYGGVADTAKAIRLNAEKEGATAKLVTAALVLDVPLSAIGDTLTLPITVAAAINRLANSEPPPDPATQKWRENWFNNEGRLPPAEQPPGNE
jgi:uncharacterized protein YceK